MITRKVASRDFSRSPLTIQRTHGQRLFEGMDWGVSEPSATRHGRAWSNWRQQFPETRRFLEHRPRKRIARFLSTLPTVCGTFTILIGRGLHAVRTTPADRRLLEPKNLSIMGWTIAERTLADEQGQVGRARGRQPHQRRRSTGSDLVPVEPTLAQLGISKKRSARANHLRHDIEERNRRPCGERLMPPAPGVSQHHSPRPSSHGNSVLPVVKFQN